MGYSTKIFRTGLQTIIAGCLLLAGSTAHALPDTSDIEARIINGHPAPAGKYPWMVAVLNATKDDTTEAHLCGGTLIDANWVLTAAHCVTDFFSGAVLPANYYEVMVGNEDLPFTRGDRAEVIGILRHPDFNLSTLEHDFALLKLDRSLPGPFMPLATAGSVSLYEAGTVATVAGWGTTDPFTPILPIHLQEASVPVKSDDQCLSEIGRYFKPDTMMCAGTLSSSPAPVDGVDACFGDSGGPLYLTLPGEEVLQIGVVSWGFNCADTRTRGVYSETAAEEAFLSTRIVFPPTLLIAPLLFGDTVLNSRLVCTPGEYTGDPVTLFTYVWMRDGADILGTTDAEYTVSPDDQGHDLSCRVVASNDGGAIETQSAPVSIPLPPPPPVPADIEAPISGLDSIRCSSKRCLLKVTAYDNVQVTAVSGTASRTYRSTCKVGKRRKPCNVVSTVPVEGVQDATGLWNIDVPLIRKKSQTLKVILHGQDAALNIQEPPLSVVKRVVAH